MATQRSHVAQMNDTVSEFLKQLGMSEEANVEFSSKANSMMALDSHRSVWFDRIIRRLSENLHQILRPRPEIDLNEPPPEDEVEAEGSQRITGIAPHIRESNADLTSAMPNPNNVRPFHNHNNQVPLIILVSDSDSD